ncbi:hypothetical protein DFH09DRAFT_1097862 [Mycena vulgaris]|nr:hypothetical protein DFH09DRAFT_1346006 [Mycena vulgaris]KAJ6521261.1 hypothetical protein DFH09DRAFT_1097862 [Mycena vulgaris]
MAPSVSHSASSSSSSEEFDAQLAECQQQADAARRRRHASIQARKEERRAAREALEAKRDQWKAASARYYENHPEVKEKKRLRMAEQRAAKKLARRRWDPPKIPKRLQTWDCNGAPCDVADVLTSVPSEAIQQPMDCVDAVHDPPSNEPCSDADKEISAAVESLLFLRASASTTGILPDRGIGDSHEGLMNARWALIAPDYDRCVDTFSTQSGIPKLMGFQLAID